MPVIFGSNGQDTIASATADDVIFGLGGDDALSSSFATADLRGGLGNDLITVDFDYLVVDAGPYPDMRWLLSGDDGDDTIFLDIDISDPVVGSGLYSGSGLTIDLIVDGGTGNDLINLYSTIGIGPSNASYYGSPAINNVVVDTDGDNTVHIFSNNFVYDTTPHTNTAIRLGSGNDQVHVSNETRGYNFESISTYDIDLGDGDNAITMSDISSRLTFSLTSGIGNDAVDLTFLGYGANSAGYVIDADVALGAGDDTFTLLVASPYDDGYLDGGTFVDFDIDLGDGNDFLSISDIFGGAYRIFAGSGDDLLFVNVGASSSYSYSVTGVDFDLGDGDDSLTSNLIGGANSVRAGTGNDSVSVTFRADGYSADNVNIDLGDGDNSLTVDAYGGSMSVVAGTGNDTVDLNWVDGQSSYNAATPTLIVDLGDGDNTLSVAIGVASAYNTAPVAQITTGSGNDHIVVYGGLGNTINAGAGNDTILGGGIDTMIGGDGDDIYTVDDVADLVVETNPNVAIGGADTVYSWLADYTLVANVEKGRIMSAGAANITGNGLNNALFAGAGNNVIDGGAGTGDSASYGFADSAVTVSLAVAGAQATGGSGLDTLISIEHLAGSLFDDHLTGSAVANWIGGDAGNDVIDGGGGNDSIRGGVGDDTIIGGTGNDRIYGETGDDTIFYGTGSNGFDIVDGGSGSNDRIVATANSTTIGLFSLTGVEVIDAAGFTGVTILGSSAANSFNFSNMSLLGVTEIDAGSGNDTVTGSNGNDVIVGNVGSDTLLGGAGNDSLYGGTWGDLLGGEGGNDLVYGQDGHDRLYGSWGSDTMLGGNGNDSLYGGTWGDVLGGDAGNDLVSGQGGHDQLYGGSGNDTIFGGNGNDTIVSGTGQDLQAGNAGNDVFVFRSAAEVGIGGARDVISDFTGGQDMMDFTAMGMAFSAGSSFTNTAGEMIAVASGGDTILTGDVNGDGVADFELMLLGVTGVSAGMFV